MDSFQWSNNIGAFEISVARLNATVPEPTPILLFLVGLAFFAIVSRRSYLFQTPH
jgi:hypothetical protein